MLRTLHDEGLLPFKAVGADGRHGHSPDVLAAVDVDPELVSLVAIPAETRCWLQGPVGESKPYRYQGAVRPTRQVVSQDRCPPSVEAIATGIPDCCWSRRTVSEGTKGPMVYECTKRRVTLSRDGLPDRPVGLVRKRRLGEQPTSWYSLRNAPLSSRLPRFVWLSGVRWAIEQCYEEAKTALGMDHDAVRISPGWPHHLLTGMLAHCFLWHLKIRLGKKSACADRVPTAGGTGSCTPQAHVDH